MQLPHGDSLFGFTALGLAPTRLAEFAPCAAALMGRHRQIRARAPAGCCEELPLQTGIGAFKKHLWTRVQGLVVAKKGHNACGSDRSEGECH